MSEAELIRLCKKQSPEGQRLLYTRYAPFLKAVLYRYIKDRDQASDILQEVFIKIFSKIKDFKEEGSFEGWMRRLTVNTALDCLRKQSRPGSIHVSIQDTSLEVEEPVDEEDMSVINHLVDAGFTKQLLIEVLNNLPENYSSVFNMFYIDEMSHKEIGDALKITEATSRKWTFRAKELVRRSLKDYLAEKYKGGTYEVSR